MHNRQRGFAMLELIATILIATLLAVWGAGTLVQKIDDAAAQTSAIWMLSVKNAVRRYVERYAPELADVPAADALAHKGYVNWAAPSLGELKADGMLSRGFPERGVRGIAVGIRLVHGGECPGDNCRLEALVYSDRAFIRSQTGRVDDQMIAQWLMAAQGWGGSVTHARPDFITGAAFEWPNPPAAGVDRLPEGTVAMAITLEQLADSQYLRVGDARNPDFQGQATVRGDITTMASLNVQDYLVLGAQNYASDACAQNGAIAREYYGGLLVCRSNRWRSAGRGGGGGFSVNSLYGCNTAGGVSTANPVTGTCGCPAGFSVVIISDGGSQTEPEGRTRGYLCVE